MFKSVIALFLLIMTSLSAIAGDAHLVQLSHELLGQQKSILYMPIGPSGSGKSTLYQKMKAVAPEIQAFSFDALRCAWYNPNDYDVAYQASVADPNFYPRAEGLFCEMLDSSADIYLDGTNLTPTKRCFYVQSAKERGYLIIGLVFSVNLETLIARQGTRGDKSIVESEVRRQYSLQVPPQIGEGFDLVFFLDDNAYLSCRQ